MNNAKDIAEKILELSNRYSPEDVYKIASESVKLASAYLELKKRIVLLLRENTLLILDSIEPRTDKDVTIVGLKKEITKLKEENETLSKDLKMCREIGVEMQREVNRKLSIENDILKSKLEKANDTIHGEFCGQKCHPLHLEVEI